jgi:uncharacterized protein YggE
MKTTIAAILLVAGALAAAAATAAPYAGAATPRTITVEGTGIATSVPDEAQFTFGVSVNAPTANAALSASSRRMNTLIAAVKGQGVPASGIQTSQISLTPNTNDNGTKILNFTAGESLTVTTKAIAKAGGIVDAAVGAGANTVDGPNLGPSSQQDLRQRALTAAITDARARALAIAKASNVSLGPVMTVNEESSSPIPFQEAKAAAAPAATPVEPGSVQTQETVTVTFGIR